MKTNLCTSSSAGDSNVRERPIQPGCWHVHRSHLLWPQGPQVTQTDPGLPWVWFSSYTFTCCWRNTSVWSLRFYGNRSYCYWCLERYYPALTDAQRSIELAPDWPKGYFRKGCALIGLQVSSCSTTRFIFLNYCQVLIVWPNFHVCIPAV